MEAAGTPPAAQSETTVQAAATPPPARQSVHSIDTGPETGSKGSHFVALILICLIFLIAFIFLVLGFGLKDATSQCWNTESPTCYTLTCPVGSTNIATCASDPSAPSNGGSYSYRCTGTNTLQCGWDPGVDRTILSADGDICSNFTSS